MSFFYKEFDFPAIPDHILAKMSIPTTVLGTNDSGYGHKHQLGDTALCGCSYKFAVMGDPILRNWLKENIPEIGNHINNPAANNTHVFVQTQAPTRRNGVSTHIVHSDVNRIAALNYIWDLGGDNVITRWYQEKGKPLQRPKSRPGIQSPDGKVNYNDLEMLEEVKLKPHRWYMLNTVVLHDVQNIESQRQGLTICFESTSELDVAGFQEHP